MKNSILSCYTMVALYFISVICFVDLKSVDGGPGPQLSDDPHPDSQLRPQAGSGIAFIAIIGCIYLAVIVYLYAKASLHFDHKYFHRKRTRSHDIDSPHSIVNDNMNDHHSHFTFMNSPLPTPKVINTVTKYPFRSVSSDDHPIQNEKVHVDNHNSNDKDTFIEEVHIDNSDNNDSSSINISNNNSNSNPHEVDDEPRIDKVDHDIDGLSSKEGIENILPNTINLDGVVYNPLQTNIVSLVKSPNELSEIVTIDNDPEFWISYVGYNSFFTKQLDLITSPYDFTGLKKLSFNDSLSNLVKLFDGDRNGFNGWINFSKINLNIQMRAQQLINIVDSCIKDSIHKAESRHNSASLLDFEVGEDPLSYDPSNNLNENQVILPDDAQKIQEWGLSMNRCRLTSENAYSIIQTVSLHPFNHVALTQLDLSNNNLDETFMVLLGNLLRNPQCAIKELSLSFVPISDTGAEMLSASLRTNKTLRHLDISYCGIERLGCYYISSSLANIPIDPKVQVILDQKLPPISNSSNISNSIRNPSAISRTSSDSELSRDSSNSAGSATPNRPSRKIARVDTSHSSRQNGSTATSFLSSIKEKNILSKQYRESISINSTLCRLNLAGNKISYYGAKDLANVLQRNSTITYLDISRQYKSKKIGPDGAREVSSALRVDNISKSVCQLTTLRCARNNIGFEGCRHLASALLSNVTLTELDIGDVNYITIAGAMQLAQAIMFNRSTRLAWLTIGEYRLPISVLIGDREIYHYTLEMRERRRLAARIEARRRYMEEQLEMKRKNSLQVGIQALASTLINSTAALIKLSDLTHPSSTNHHDRHNGNDIDDMNDDIDGIENHIPRSNYELENSTDRVHKLMRSKPSRPVSIFPISLHLTRVHHVNYFTKTFTSSSKHGMNDESGVVIGTLLQQNRNLLYLKLEETFLPIQQLQGTIATRHMDFSDRNLKSIDTIVIGILVADNERVRTLNLRGNNFAETEGENYIAYALERNQKLSLDLAAWPAEKMFSDGYRTLASRQGLSASGAIIEPQRLEGWFYQGLTIYSALFYYISLVSDCIALNTFITQPQVYRLSWTIISAFLICFSSCLYAYATFRNLMNFDLKDACIQAAIVLAQLTPAFQAYECVMASMESTAMLDYKYVMGVYKSIPQTFLKTYIMFSVAMTDNQFDITVLISNALAIISITVIFIMRYDRKEARRISMASVSDQPLCAVYVAAFLTACGMGKDTVHVEGFVNFDSYYTSHYVWAYIYQLVSIYSRVVSLSWLLATVPYGLQILVPFVIIWTRCMLLIFVDDQFFHKTFYHNFVKSLSLGISDSAWAKDEQDSVFSRLCVICLGLMTTCEEAIAAVYVTFVSTYLQYPIIHRQSYFIGIFISLIIAWIIRWFLTFHWLFHIHFPELYIDDPTVTSSTAAAASSSSSMAAATINYPISSPKATIAAPGRSSISNGRVNFNSLAGLELNDPDILDNMEQNPVSRSPNSKSTGLVRPIEEITSAISEQFKKAADNIKFTVGWKPKSRSTRRNDF